MNDRRSQQRCPVCQGPATPDETRPEGVRCRNSTCVYNHEGRECPRCKRSDLEAVTYSGGKWQYTCRECTHVWTVAG